MYIVASNSPARCPTGNGVKYMRDFLKNLKLNEQNISMLLGIVVVLLVGSLLYNYFKSVNKPSQGETSSTTAPEQVQVPSGDKLPADYTVQKGDTLWSISTKAYGSGYNWVDVYAANKTVIGKNANSLLADTKLTLPKIKPKPATEYTVVNGDNLWNILVKICNNGYLWTKVAKTNNLANASRIEIGQKLSISCN